MYKITVGIFMGLLLIPVVAFAPIAHAATPDELEQQIKDLKVELVSLIHQLIAQLQTQLDDALNDESDILEEPMADENDIVEEDTKQADEVDAIRNVQGIKPSAVFYYDHEEKVVVLSLLSFLDVDTFEVVAKADLDPIEGDFQIVEGAELEDSYSGCKGGIKGSDIKTCSYYRVYSVKEDQTLKFEITVNGVKEELEFKKDSETTRSKQVGQLNHWY